MCVCVCLLDRISRFSCIKYSSTSNFTNKKWWVRVCLCLWHCYSMAQIKVALPAGQISFHFFINFNCESECVDYTSISFECFCFSGGPFPIPFMCFYFAYGRKFSQITFYTCSFEYLHWFYMRIVLPKKKVSFFVSVPLKTLFVVDYKSLPPQFQRKFLYQQSHSRLLYRVHSLYNVWTHRV